MITDALQAISDQLLNWQFKSAPSGPDAGTVGELGAAQPSLFDVGFLPPIMTLRQSALEANLHQMADYCRQVGVQLAPHGKTHMAPQLAARQLEAGAWGVTVANVSQARVYRAFGVARIFCANELVDAASIAWVASELEADPAFTFLCYVDSVDGVRLLGRTLAQLPGDRPIDVIVELGFTGGRTGCRDLDAASAVALEVTRTPRLRLVGVSCFEGGIGHGDEPDPAVIAEVRALLRLVRDAATALAPIAAADAPFYVSAGGSVFFDLVAEELAGKRFTDREATVLLRSGCYLVHDSGAYRRQTPFGRTVPGSLQAAVRLWGVVLSLPEPGLALVGIGRRDVSFDMDLPLPEVVRRADGTTSSAGALQVTSLDDQHAYVRVDDAVALAVGDWVGFGISHPCTALDKWQLLVVVDDDDHVVDCVRTFF